MEKHSNPVKEKKNKMEEKKEIMLKVDPKKMSKPPLEQPKVRRTSQMTREAAISVTEYFREQKRDWTNGRRHK